MSTQFSRAPEHPVADLFIKRWSPRAFSGAPLDRTSVFSLFEAARWAPSANNAQPRRFIYSLRDSPTWPSFLNLLNDKNRQWAANASALVVLISKTTYRRKGASSRIPTSYRKTCAHGNNPISVIPWRNWWRRGDSASRNDLRGSAAST